MLSLIIKSVVRHFLSQDKRLQSEDSDEEKGHMKQQAGTNMVKGIFRQFFGNYLFISCMQKNQ